MFEALQKVKVSHILAFVLLSFTIYFCERIFYNDLKPSGKKFDKIIQINVTMTFEGFKKTQLSRGTFKFNPIPTDQRQKFTFQDFITAVKHDVSFLDQFLKVLTNEVTFESYYFECPPVNAKTLDEKNFEFVLVESDTLHWRRPDPEAFAEHFNHHCSTTVFDNLGGDSTLIAPCPSKQASFPHLAAFMRKGSNEQIEDFWKKVASEFSSRIEKDKPRNVWLSTAGDGISWLHMRLDPRPKYYQHSEYQKP